MKTAKNIIKELPLNMNDIARLTLEATEELGEREQGLTRLAMLQFEKCKNKCDNAGSPPKGTLSHQKAKGRGVLAG